MLRLWESKLKRGELYLRKFSQKYYLNNPDKKRIDWFKEKQIDFLISRSSFINTTN